jgi:hypothetical protein
MDVNAHAIFIDVTDLKVKGFVQSKPAGIDGIKVSFVLRCINGSQDGSNLIEAQYSRQPPFAFCPYQFQCVPLLFKHINKKKLDATVANAHRGR